MKGEKSMKKNIFSVVVMSIIFLMFLIPQEAEAKKVRRSGRADGMASIEVEGNLDSIKSAVKAVFDEDGYKLKLEETRKLTFSRAAGRMKDIAYGGIIGGRTGGGQWEQVFISIHEEEEGYRIECNVYMTEGNKDVPSTSDTKVLKFFGREYKKMLKRIKKQVEKKKGEKE
jgi:hypothetical protein